MVDEEKLIKEQNKLAKRIVLKNDVDEYRLIAGCDAVYTGRKIIYAIIVFDTEMNVKEKKYTVMNAQMPYMKDYVAYRDSPVAVETYHKLEIDPDVLMVVGAGIMHPRKIGMASHLGLLIDKPTLGVSKEVIHGEVEGDYIYGGNEKIGILMKTKEHAKPIYVSPGHRVSMQRALDIAKENMGDKKLPIPLHETHKFANKIKKKIKEEKKEG